ncbi:MAG TPA: methyltransferase [Geobacteraceae bacterium]|nr:methyltransferase [Geobacteraceae bacterium]
MGKIDWNIPDLLQLSGGYWSTCALHAGVRLELFIHLAAGERTAGEAAGLCHTDPRGTEMLLDALSSLGLLDKRGDSYGLTPFAAQTLVKSSPSYMGHIIMHHHHLMAGWSRLHEAVTSGSPVRSGFAAGEDETARESFLMGMFNLASQLAPRIAGAIDLSGRRRLLDLGGGPGTYAVHFCLQNPDLVAVIYDLPTTRNFAEGVVRSFDLDGRIEFTAGDYHTDPLPAGFAVAWLSHVLHSDGPQKCAALLAKAVGSLEDGGLLLVQEFILDDTKDGPQFPALFALNMLLGTVAGRSYSGAELMAMMAAAGLTEIRRIPLDLPNGAGILVGRKNVAGQQ